MRVPRSTRQLLTSLMGALTLVGVGAEGVQAANEIRPPTAIQFSLDRPVDATASPFVLALTEGFFGAEGVNVTTSIASGSPDTIARVAAGTSDLALADINALIRYRDKTDAAPVKAVFVLVNKAPYAIIARKSRGIKTLADVEGKSIGVADGDLAIRLWPALARRNGIAIKTVKQEKISAAVREPLLSAGQIDAVTGFSYLSAVNLKDRGVPSDDLTVLRFADYGCEAYGQVIIVNPKFAADKPEAVRSFLRATVAGTKLAIKQPARAIADVLAQMSGGSRDLERERLDTMIRDNILSADVRRDGLGGIDEARFDKSIDQMAEDFVFRKRPKASDIFDGSFLGPASGRAVD